MESQLERWRYDVLVADQPKLWPLLEALERLRSHGLTTAMVVAAFHCWRVLSLMAWWKRLFEMTPDESIDGVRLSTVTLSDEEILHRVRETVEGWLRSSGLSPFLMRPMWGYISLGIRDVRASSPPVPEDAERRAVNRAHAKAQKMRKDAKEARCKRKNLECDELEKRRRQQRHDGLPVEPSLSLSLSNSSSDDDEGEVEAPALAPRKALKVSTSSTTQWVMEAQAAIQHGAASARADPKESDAQGEATKAATKQAGEEAPTPHEAEALMPDEAKAPLIAEATEGEAEALRTSEAKATEARASRTTEAEVAKARASRTTEAKVAEAGAPGTTKAEVAEAGLGTAEQAAQDVETEAGQASVPPLVHDLPPSPENAREAEVHSISSDDTFWGKEVADAEAASTIEPPALTSSEGSSALVWVRPEPHKWDSPRVLWQSQDDPEGEPLFALEDVVEGGRWDSFEQFHYLAERSLRTALSVMADALLGELKARSLRKSLFLQWERDIWDQLWQQKDLLTNANDLLSARSMEVEDLRLCCADMKAEAAMAQEQAIPLVARIKELEEELTRVAELEREACRAAEASQAEVQNWREKAEGLEKEVSQAAEASVEVQAVLEAEIGEHNALGRVHEQLRGALHTGVKRALTIISSHYTGIDLEAISDGYILAKDDEEAEEEVMRLVELAEAPSTALAKLFEEEVVPPAPSADAGDLEF
ncbi:basal body protein 10-like [Miscanthus floridulus]|uniref:basal body protein 10-like n=1 Tax=Miscanthus floridulus TaxID=154761 RepID=UPI00345B2518